MGNSSGVETKPSNIRKDCLTGIRVIIAVGRERRITDLKEKLEVADTPVEKCPFCPGHEDRTPPEIWRWPFDNNQPWKVRVIPNKWAAMLVEGTSEVDEKHRVNYQIIGAKGAHEVGIMTPDHQANLATLSVDQLALVLQAIFSREQDLYYHVPGIEFIQTWINYGSQAGATQSHAHFQLICLPLNAGIEISYAARTYRDDHQRTIFETILEEAETDNLIFLRYPNFVALCPFASFQPFMIRVFPLLEVANLETAKKIHHFELAQILSESFHRLKKAVGFLPPLNVIFHEAPYFERGTERYFRFWIDIIPAINTPAGFEWGTYFHYFINPTPPEEAVEFLRNAQI